LNGRLVAWCLAVLLSAALGLQVREAARRMKASQILEVVKTVTQESRRHGRLTKGVINSNIKLLRLAERLNPAEVLLPIARGGQYVRLKRWDSAIQAFETALEIEPRGDIYRHIGRANFSLGRRDEADRAFRLAILLDHNQRRALKGYLQTPRPKAVVEDTASPPDLIFQSSFESGDLSGWRRSASGGKDDVEASKKTEG